MHLNVKALSELKNGKTPGIDSLPTDFYKCLWLSIQKHVTNAIHYTFLNGEMSTSQKLGIITLIPKKDKDRLYLKTGGQFHYKSIILRD